MGAPRFKETSWSGRPNYECELCPFATLDKGRMLNHVRIKHPTDAELARAGVSDDPLDGVAFASPQAESLARTLGLDARHFDDQTATAQGGFSVSDVDRLSHYAHEGE